MNKEQLQEMRIQFYEHPVTNAVSHKEVSVADIFCLITSDRYRDITLKLRSIEDEKERKAFKATHFDFVTFSGLFSYRKDGCMTKHSGLMSLDIDHIGPRLQELKKALPNDPYFETELLFISPSGDGLKWIVWIDLNDCDHRTWFRAIQNYMRQAYDVEVDEKCINESRTCFLPFDATVYVNPLICEF